MFDWELLKKKISRRREGNIFVAHVSSVLVSLLPDQWGSLFPRTLLPEVWRQSQTKARPRQPAYSESISPDTLRWHRGACADQSQIFSLVTHFN